MLPKTNDIHFLIPRASVQGDLFGYKNQRSTLHGVTIIQPASGLFVEGDPRIGILLVITLYFRESLFWNSCGEEDPLRRTGPVVALRVDKGLKREF